MFSYLLGKDHHVCVQGENSFSLERFARAFATGMIAFLLAVGMHLPALAACPPAEKLKMDIERLTRRTVEILSVRPSALPSLCEIVTLSDSQKQVFYTDTSNAIIRYMAN